MVRIFSPEANARAEVARLAGFFEQTGNAAAAWRCWHLARIWRLPVPDSVVAEVDRFAAGVASITDAALAGDPNARLDSQAVARLWSGVAPGKREPAGALVEAERNTDAAVAVLMKRNGGKTEAAAVAEVAAEMGMSASSVRVAVRDAIASLSRDSNESADSNEAR